VFRTFPGPRPQAPAQIRCYATRLQRRLPPVYRWASSPRFYQNVIVFAAFASGVWVYNLETVPVSGRKRFNIVKPEWEVQMGQWEYESIMNDPETKKNILPAYHPSVVRVKRVMSRLVSGLDDLQRSDDEYATGHKEDMLAKADKEGDLEKWEVHVIESKQVNAFVIPGYVSSNICL
jgi:metalloendopeptidase OMA1, mitochondrial